MKKTSRIQENLMAALQAYRLNQEIVLIDKELEDLKAEQTNEKKGFAKVVDKVVSEPLRAGKEKRLLEDVLKAHENLENFLGSLPEGTDASLYQDEEKLRSFADVFFDRDDGYARLTMGLELALMEGDAGAPKYLRREASRERLSKLLLVDEKLLTSLQEAYVYTFRFIDGQSDDSEDKEKAHRYSQSALAVGLAAGWTIIGLAVSLGLAAQSFFYEARSMRKMYEQERGLDLFSAFIGGGQSKKKKLSKGWVKKIKKLGRECPEKDYIHSLTLGIVLYDFRFLDKKNEAAKNALSLFLQMLDDLRSDAEYLALVERVDIDSNAKKLTAASRAIELLLRLTRKEEEKGKVGEAVIYVEQVA